MHMHINTIEIISYQWFYSITTTLFVHWDFGHDNMSLVMPYVERRDSNDVNSASIPNSFPQKRKSP